MTDPCQPLRALLAQAQRQRDQALAELHRLDAARLAADRQAEQLLLYRREHEARWQAQFRLEGRMELVHCHQGFMERLGDAIAQQLRIAAHAATQVERAAAIVRAHEIRTSALDELIGRRLRESRRAADRSEQKETDDFAARAAWHRTARYGATIL